jgi:hypothetical protein
LWRRGRTHSSKASWVDGFVDAAIEQRLVDGADPRERAMAALVAVGPGGTPPPAVWEQLEALVEKYGPGAPDRPRGGENPVDLTIAFGCGWGRIVEPGATGWAGRFANAVLAMSAIVRASVSATNELLRNQLPQFALTSDDLDELPSYFALSLLGGCDCVHHRRGCGGACGRECCFGDHDLATWDPATCHLRPFVDQAVRGTAAEQILGGAFADSMLYRQLEREGRILRRRVEFRRCPGCGQLYDTAMCPTPGCDPPPGQVPRRVARPNWLILPEHEGGRYREVVRWVCGDRDCASLYPIRFRRTDRIVDDPCPVCGWEPGAKPAATVTVWVRLTGRATSTRGLRVAELPDPCGFPDEEAADD